MEPVNPETESQKLKLIKIIGFGNIFMSDDGIGIKVIEELEKSGFHKEKKFFEIIDGSTSGVDLLFNLRSSDCAIIVDAIDAGQAIGKIEVFKLKDIADESVKKITSFSLHDLNLHGVLSIMKVMNLSPDITFIGIKPKSIEYGDRMSPEIEKRIPDIISLIYIEIDKYLNLYNIPV